MWQELAAGMEQTAEEPLSRVFPVESGEMVLEKEVFARRLQIQEQMTGQIADAMMEFLAPKGVMVVIEAEHTCMTARGIKKPGSKTVTIATRGVFADNEALQNRFFQMLGK